MFDRYQLLEYLLTNVYNRNRISYGEIYNVFDVESGSIPDFLNTLEQAERMIVQDILGRDQIPIYSVILFRRIDGLPGIGFYDVFRNRNRELYNEIAGNLSVQEVFNNDPRIKQRIFNVSMELLENDLNDRFPNLDTVVAFIDEARINRDI